MSVIAFVSTMSRYPWGGSEELWSRTALHLAREGHRIFASVKWWENPAPRIEELRRVGISVEMRRAARRARFLGVPLPGRVADPGADWFRTTAPDLVVVSQGGSLELAPWAERCATLGIPYAAIAHSGSPHSWPADASASRLAAAYDGAKAAFFVAEATARLVATQTGARLDNRRILRNPFGVAHDAAWPWPDDRGNARMACIGRLDLATKGYDLLMDVLAMPEWRRRPVTLDLYGEGPQQGALERLIRERGLADVRLRGRTDDIGSVWADHHLCLMPSRQESMPIALVEAMLCGRPVIVTDVGGIREMVEDGVTGFIAATASASSFAEAMERAWTARDDWPRMGQAAAEAVRRKVPSDPVREFASRLLGLRGEG